MNVSELLLFPLGGCTAVCCRLTCPFPVLPAAAHVLLVLSDDGEWTNTLTSVLSLPDGQGAWVVRVHCVDRKSWAVAVDCAWEC